MLWSLRRPLAALARQAAQPPRDAHLKITALEEYGLRCMLQLSRAQGAGPVTVAQVAEREGMSTEYAGKLLNMLGQAGLVRSVRGRKGGFVLARPADEITLAQIVRPFTADLFDSEYCERHAGAGETCVHSTACTLRPVWTTLSAMISQTLESLTLMDLLRSERQLSHDLQPRLGEPPARIEANSPLRTKMHEIRVPASR